MNANSQVRSASRKPAAQAARVPAEIRQSRIMAAFARDGFVSIAGLTAELGVSGMTIRRDVSLLESRGLFRRTHGGAIAADVAQPYDTEEPAFDQRMRHNASAKRAMAVAAAGMIGAGESVALDVGTSVLALADALAGRDDLRIITNNLRVGMSLSDSKASVYILGGQIRYPEGSVIGHRAVESLADRFIDRVFLGVSGLDGSGLYDYSPEDTEVKRAFMASAGSVVVLCDASKFGRRALSRIASLDAIDILLTDRPPPPELAEALRDAGTEILVAP